MIDRQSKRVLILSQKKEWITTDDIKTIEPDKSKATAILKSLASKGYLLEETNPRIIPHAPPNKNVVFSATGRYKIKPDGRAIVEDRYGAWIRMWWPLIISTLALIRASWPDILWLWAKVAQVLKK